jgi:hypothetical protein
MMSGEPMLGPRQPHRIYDVCLVFPYKVRALIKWGDTADARDLKAPTEEEKELMLTWEEERDLVLASLRQAGLVISAFYSRDRDEVFCKVGLDGTKLMELAEQTRYPLQMKEQYCGAFAEYRRDSLSSVQSGYQGRQVFSALYEQHPPLDAYPDETTVFQTLDRIRLIDYAIRSRDKNCAGVAIGELIKKKYLKAYFPLHEAHSVRHLEDIALEAFVYGTELDKVRAYCGEKVGFYFLWQTYLNKWLFFGMAISGIFFLADLYMETPNNMLTPVFAFVVVFWLCAFMAAWKRTCVTTALRWGTLQRADEVEPARPEFHGTKMVSPITGRPETYYPARKRACDMITSYAVLAVTMAIMCFLVLMIFTIRHLLNHAFPFGGRIFFMFLLALGIEIANLVFHEVAKRLNTWENHRTDRDFETHLLAKTFIFKCGSTFGPLFYILFLKRHSHLFGMEMDCMGGDCMVDLTCQLAMFYFVKLVFGNFIEWVWPVIYTSYQSYMEHRDMSVLSHSGSVVDMSPAEQQSKRDIFETFENLDEVVITYGLTVLFWSAAPWAPAAMLGSNLIEAWGDAHKMLRTCKRPYPGRAKDNEPWDTAFTLITHLAVFTNIGTAVFADTSLELTMTEKIIAFFLFQHAYFGVMLVVNYLFPPMPEAVKNLMLKQAMIVKKAVDGTMDDVSLVTAYQAPVILEDAEVKDRDDEDEEESLAIEGCNIM